MIPSEFAGAGQARKITPSQVELELTQTVSVFFFKDNFPNSPPVGHVYLFPCRGLVCKNLPGQNYLIKLTIIKKQNIFTFIFNYRKSSYTNNQVKYYIIHITT